MERQKQITSSDVFLHQFKRTFFIILILFVLKIKPTTNRSHIRNTSMTIEKKTIDNIHTFTWKSN